MLYNININVYVRILLCVSSKCSQKCAMRHIKYLHKWQLATDNQQLAIGSKTRTISNVFESRYRALYFMCVCIVDQNLEQSDASTQSVVEITSRTHTTPRKHFQDIENQTENAEIYPSRSCHSIVMRLDRRKINRSNGPKLFGDGRNMILLPISCLTTRFRGLCFLNNRQRLVVTHQDALLKFEKNAKRASFECDAVSV